MNQELLFYDVNQKMSSSPFVGVSKFIDGERRAMVGAIEHPFTHWAYLPDIPK